MNRNADPNYPIVDGFVLDTLLKCNLQFRALATQKFEAIRRASGMRSRWWLCPESAATDFEIPAFDAYEYAIPIVPGSVIWGFIFVASGNAGPFSFNVSDNCTDVPLFSEVIRADNFGLNSLQASRQQFLPRPVTIAEPGLVNVQICSQQTTAAQGVQLILCGGEPVTRQNIGG